MYQFQKAVDYLDRMHYSQWRFEHFVEANRIAGNPFPMSKLQMLWDHCAEVGPEDQAVMLMEVFREMARKHGGALSVPMPSPNVSHTDASSSEHAVRAGIASSKSRCFETAVAWVFIAACVLGVVFGLMFL